MKEIEVMKMKKKVVIGAIVVESMSEIGIDYFGFKFDSNCFALS